MSDSPNSENNNITFDDLMKQVDSINDFILSSMINENKNHDTEELVSFNVHLAATKAWFTKISWSNKKRYLLSLLDDVRSAWTMSLLLKSIWNCRPKDAVLSSNDFEVWSCYDLVPLDHNRTAQPMPSLAKVMKDDRLWFQTLEPESQAMVLSELLIVSGGPIMWNVLSRATAIYNDYRAEQLQDFQNSITMNEPLVAVKPPVVVNTVASQDKNKKEVSQQQRQKPPGVQTVDPTKLAPQAGPAQKELETNLILWNATIKSLRDSIKLEELEMNFNDGTKKNIWKVNRPKPEVMETVDFMQLLPSAVGKRIISYLPRAHLADYARVNKYWAYLVEDFRAELAARLKIDTDMSKLQELMLRYDLSKDLESQVELKPPAPSSQSFLSVAPSGRAKRLQRSVMFHRDRTKQICKIADLTDRLDRRGAADENLWNWCINTVRNTRNVKKEKMFKTHRADKGVLPLKNKQFPCPPMKFRLQVPLQAPLCKDPATVKTTNLEQNIYSEGMENVPKEPSKTQYKLWMKDFTKLYPTLKISAYQSPV